MMPDDLSELFGGRPNVAHAIGAPRITPTGRLIGGSYPETYCVYRLRDRPDADISAAVDSANQWLLKKKRNADAFVKSGGTLEYYITLESDDRLATTLRSEVLGFCVKYNVTISLEILKSNRRRR
jgi:hypothetical protein